MSALAAERAHEQAGPERTYKCRCGGFLTRSALTWGVARDVYCRSCRRRQDVYFGGRHEDAPPALDRTKGTPVH